MKQCRHRMSPDNFKTLISCLRRLKKWNPQDSEIAVSNDYDKMSFFFRQRYSNGNTGLCGGIIFHGARDGYGSGNGPTFSVTMEKTEGYQIHT